MTKDNINMGVVDSQVSKLVSEIKTISEKFLVFGRPNLANKVVCDAYINNTEKNVYLKYFHNTGLRKILQLFKDLGNRGNYIIYTKLKEYEKSLSSSNKVYCDKNGLYYWILLLYNVDYFLSLSDEEIISEIKGLSFDNDMINSVKEFISLDTSSEYDTGVLYFEEASEFDKEVVNCIEEVNSCDMDDFSDDNNSNKEVDSVKDTDEVVDNSEHLNIKDCDTQFTDVDNNTQSNDVDNTQSTDVDNTQSTDIDVDNTESNFDPYADYIFTGSFANEDSFGKDLLDVSIQDLIDYDKLESAIKNGNSVIETSISDNIEKIKNLYEQNDLSEDLLDCISRLNKALESNDTAIRRVSEILDVGLNRVADIQKDLFKLKSEQSEDSVKSIEDEIHPVDIYEKDLHSYCKSVRDNLERKGIKWDTTFKRNLERLTSATKKTNLIGVKGSTGSGKSTLVKVWACGYKDVENTYKGYADYYTEVNIDNAISNEDIFIEKQLNNSTTINCDTPIMKLVRVLEEDYRLHSKEENYKPKKGVVVISDPTCDELDKVLSLIKAWAGFENEVKMIGDLAVHVLPYITWVIIYNDRGKGSIQLSGPMMRRMVSIIVNKIENPKISSIRDNFDVNMWGIYGDKIRALLECIKDINKLLSEDVNFVDTGFISYAPIQYPATIFESHADIANIVDTYRDMYTNLCAEIGSDQKCLNDMYTVLSDFDSLLDENWGM